MKTTGMNHQLEALRRSNGRDCFAYFMEQGTGKTWTILADAERMYSAGLIDGLLVIAPNGVHANWVLREIPAHMDCPNISRAWASGAGVKEMKRIEEIFQPSRGAQNPLRILAMNIDALNTKKGYEFAERFLIATKAMITIDESSRIKNPAAGRTKNIMKLSSYAFAKRIATGTPIGNAPVDLFSQFEFMESGLLGTTSYRAFVAEYAELIPKDHPMMQNMIKNNPRIAHAQIVAKNPDGSMRWRNLDKLQRLILPHSFRVLKKDCLDLPDKIYQQVYFDLTPKQQKAYDFLQDELRIELPDDEVATVAELAAIVKLQQMTSGFVNMPDGSIHYVDEENPRINALVDLMEDIQGKVIIWARFKEELRAISCAMKKIGRNVVEYHGDINKADREFAVDSIQNGAADTFVGQQQSGGIGLTLTAAETSIYVSNDYSSEGRKQSEDRNHRIGTKNNVVYIDLIARGTVDEKIIRVLRRKANLAAEVLGDFRK
jgi:SNF2 family DNA or RNA helicase